MYSNKLYSPLRYPGGKAPFAPFIAKVMEKNGLIGGHYLEPYAGGAGVALDIAASVDHERAAIVRAPGAQLDGLAPLQDQLGPGLADRKGLHQRSSSA